MNFSFSKAFIYNDPARRYGRRLRLYTLYDDEGQELGQFFYTPNKQFVQYNGREISIEAVARVLQKTKYLLTDTQGNEEIGTYHMLGGYGMHTFWEDVPSAPIGTLETGGELFNFRRINPGAETAQQKGWDRYKFRLYALTGTDYYDFALQIERPNWKTTSVVNSSFTGTITTNAGNIFAMLAAFYLMEREFEHEDAT